MPFPHHNNSAARSFARRVVRYEQMIFILSRLNHQQVHHFLDAYARFLEQRTIEHCAGRRGLLALFSCGEDLPSALIPERAPCPVIAPPAAPD